MVDRAAFGDWIENYERLWRSTGTAGLATLFTDDAGYQHSPYEEPIVGLPRIAADWEQEREAPDEVFTMTASIVAVEGDTGVAKVLVRYGEPLRQEYQDVWLVRFAADGRCSWFEEWPFWPEQPGHSAASEA